MTNKSVLKDYLKKYVEGYLMGDLQRMINLPFVSRKKGTFGELGYTCLLVMCTGMELLGSLLVREREKLAFDIFWSYMHKVSPKKYTQEVRDLFWKAIRHKLAHMFTLTSGVMVDRKNIPHLERDNDGALYINCEMLFKDFREAYKEIRKDLLDERQLLEKRIDFINKEIGEQTNSVLIASTSIPTNGAIDHNVTGASGISGELQKVFSEIDAAGQVTKIKW